MDGFIQRDRELSALTQLFSEGARIVSVTGTAGIGKTRLVREWLPEGGVFVDLSEAESQDDIESRVAEALDAPKAFGEKGQHLRRIIAARGDGYLALDNFEHLVEHAPTTLGRWIRGTSARFVVTSRERLQLRDESVLALSPLELPGDTQPERAASVRLLIERAKQRSPAIDMKGSDLEALAAIARLLDGLPLALELAAAPLVQLGAAALLKRLEQDFGVLEGQRDALSATIAWSWDLLDEHERSALAQCSVFQGGFNLAAAEAIFDVPKDVLVVDVLQSLFDKSLIHVPSAGRFSLYRSIKAFASSKLEGHSEVLRRHAKYYAALGEKLVRQVEGELADESWEQLKRERDNLGLAADHEDPELAAAAVDPLTLLIISGGTSQRDEARLDRAIERSKALRPRLLAQRGKLKLDQGGTDQAADDLDEAIKLAKANGDLRTEAQAVLHRSRVTLHRGDAPGAAKALAEVALPLAERSGNQQVHGGVLATIGVTQGAMGNAAEAGECFHQALSIYQTTGAVREEALALDLIGFWHASAGRTAESLVALATAEAIQERINAKADALYSAWVRSMAMLAQGDYAGARATLDQSTESAKRIGAVRYAGVLLGCSALCKVLAHNDYAGARSEAERAIELAEETKDARIQVLCGALAGGCAAKEGDAHAARAHLAQAQKIVDALGDPILKLCVEVQRAHLEPDTLEDVLTRAREKGNAEEAPIEVSLDLKLFARTHQMAKASSSTSPAPRGSKGLTVDLDSGRFVPPGAIEPIDISGRDALLRILTLLVESHEQDPEAFVTRQELGHAGWPDSQGSEKAMTNRVHVSVATLRKLGLQSALLSRRGAYRLLPQLEVQRAELAT